MPNAQMTIMRPAGAGATTRYVDVEKYGMVVAPQDCPLLPGQQFPIPYATLPVRQPLGHPGAAAMRPRAGSQVCYEITQNFVYYLKSCSNVRRCIIKCVMRISD